MVTYCDICNTKLYRGKVCKTCESDLLETTFDEMDKNPMDAKRLAATGEKAEDTNIEVNIDELIEFADNE